MPHDQCPGNRRGHTWHALSWHVSLPDATRAIRVCGRCGAVGRVNKQGIIDATGDRVDLGEVRLADRKAAP